jgi:RimJ/RimL family protein N-acetyltransferase
MSSAIGLLWRTPAAHAGVWFGASRSVCLLHEQEIVGWCLSEYNAGPRCEIGIATAEPFRRRGLATLMARAFIDHALTQGVYDIGWICWAGNRPSVATAEKLGFELVDERDVFVA